MSSESDTIELIRLPPYLRIECDYGVIVCTEHRTAYTLANISEHLSRKHGLKNPTKRDILFHIKSSGIQAEVRQPEDYSQPIPGLAVIRGAQCNVGNCTHRSKSHEVVQRHCSTKHALNSETERQRKGAITDVLLQHWFARTTEYWIVTPRRASTVPSSSPISRLPILPSSTSSPFKASDSVLHQLADTVVYKQQERRRTVQQPEHTAELSPWLRLCRYYEHFDNIDPQLIGSSYMIPQSTTQHPVLYYVHLSVTRVLQSAYEQRAELHHIDSRRLNSFEEGRTKQMGLPALQEKDSLTRYIRKFCQLSCYFYRVTREDHFETKLFVTTPAQTSALDSLLDTIQDVSQHLTSVNMDADTVIETTDHDLQSLYARLDQMTLRFLRELVEQPTKSGGLESAILSYCAAASWDVKQGAWMDETQSASLLSSVVYCCQLIILADSHLRVQDDEFSDLASAIKELSSRWLTTLSRGPMCDLLRLRLYAMKVALNVVHPGQFRWHDDNNTLVFRDISYRITDLRVEIEFYLNQAKLIFRDDLCLGASNIPSFNLALFHDNWETRKPGESFLSDIRNAPLIEPCRNWWIEQAASSFGLYNQIVHMSSDGDTVQQHVRSAFAIEFERSVQSFLGYLALLIHKGSGQPARSKEFLSIRLENKDLARRNVFIHDGYFLFLLTYHKALNRTHASRYPVRFLLPEVGVLLMQFIVLIQPVRRMFCEAVSVPAQVSEYIWHDGSQVWTDAHLLRLVQSSSECAVGVKISMQAWRQIAVAIASKRFSGMQYQADIDLPAADADEEDHTISIQESFGGAMPDVFHLQAAHSAFTGRRIYGGSVNFQGGLTDAALHEYLKASRMWHQLCLPQQSTSTAGHRRKASALEPVSLDPPLMKRIALKQQSAREIPRWTHEDVQLALKALFPDRSNPSFRTPQQAALIQAILEGQPEVVGILATGEGKSLAFLLPTVLPGAGTTVVLVPLVALKGDMLRRCEEADIAYTVWDSDRASSEYLGAPLLFVSVEQAVRSQFRTFLGLLDARRALDRIVIDEAHLVITASSYRPRLALIQRLRSLYCQMVFLTGTLPPLMQSQFEKKMLLQDSCFIRSQTCRLDIVYYVWRSKRRNMVQEAIEGIHRVLDGENDPSGRIIVYTQTRAEADILAKKLGCPVYYSDSGTQEEKQVAMNKWRQGETKEKRIIVATSAFGMGIDFPCVRHVFHYGAPRDLIGFVQEAGRLGRDKNGGCSHILLPYDWQAPSLPTSMDQRRSSVSELAMTVYLSQPRCYIAVLSRFLDGPEEMKYCSEESDDDRCGQCQLLGLFNPSLQHDPTVWWDPESGHGAEFDTESSPAASMTDEHLVSVFNVDRPPQNTSDSTIIAIPPTQSVYSGGPDRLRSTNATEALGRERYLRRLAVSVGRCMVCLILGEGLISAQDQQHKFTECPHHQRWDFISAKRTAIQRNRQRGGWLKSYAACFNCGQPQDVCEVLSVEEKSLLGDTHAQGPSVCRYRDLALPAAWALFHTRMRYGRTLGEITGVPQKHWDSEENWMDWIGTECQLYGMRACQAVRLLDWLMEQEFSG